MQECASAGVRECGSAGVRECVSDTFLLTHYTCVLTYLHEAVIIQQVARVRRGKGVHQGEVIHQGDELRRLGTRRREGRFAPPRHEVSSRAKVAGCGERLDSLMRHRCGPYK